MSANSLNKPPVVEHDVLPGKVRVTRSRLWIIALPVWVLAGFGATQFILVSIVQALSSAGVPFAAMNLSVLNAILAAICYVLSALVIIGLPWWIKKYRTTKKDVGLTRLPSWMDILLAPAGGVVYIVCSVALLALVKAYLPGIDLDQVQQTGFSNLSHQYEYLLAFLTLIVIAPVFEEILFRGFLYGKLRKRVPAWVATVIVSVVFAAVHGQWNVAFDVFALSVVLCTLREITGNIWAGIFLHMCKNGLAFYVLFVNPEILRTIGG